MIERTYAIAPMPKIIQKHQSGQDVTGPKYQKYDYQIAASTYLFNQTKNDLQLYTDGNQLIPKSQNAQIPNLDPTVLKSIIVHETVAGTDKGQHGTVDVMQVNNTVSHNADWGNYKAKFGLKKGVLPTPAESINFAPINLIIKGFHGAKGTYDGDLNILTFPWLGIDEAIKNYNGGGDPDYLPDIKTMLQNAQDSKPENYVENKPASTNTPAAKPKQKKKK